MKKVKMNEWDFYHFLEGINNSYYSFQRNAIIKEGKKIYGTLYKLSRPLSDNDKTELLKWKNIRLFISQCQYAPEIKNNAVFVADKCL